MGLAITLAVLVIGLLAEFWPVCRPRKAQSPPASTGANPVPGDQAPQFKVKVAHVPRRFVDAASRVLSGRSAEIPPGIERVRPEDTPLYCKVAYCQNRPVTGTHLCKKHMAQHAGQVCRRCGEYRRGAYCPKCGSRH